MYAEDDFKQLSSREKSENTNEIKKCPLVCHYSSISIILVLLSISLYSSIFQAFKIINSYANVLFYNWSPFMWSYKVAFPV